MRVIDKDVKLLIECSGIALSGKSDWSAIKENTEVTRMLPKTWSQMPRLSDPLGEWVEKDGIVDGESAYQRKSAVRKDRTVLVWK